MRLAEPSTCFLFPVASCLRLRSSVRVDRLFEEGGGRSLTPGLDDVSFFVVLLVYRCPEVASSARGKPGPKDATSFHSPGSLPFQPGP